jgi:hypothetical protein
MTTIALMVAGAVSTGGAVALVVTKFLSSEPPRQLGSRVGSNLPVG